MNYNSEIINTNSYLSDKKQEEYYDRICKFLKSDDNVLVNPGGMGLGKTFATAISLKHNLTDKQFGFIACPTAPLKSIWSNDMNRCGLNKNHSIWFAKDDCCIKKSKDNKFDTKNCKDDCIFWSNIESNGKIKEKMMEEVSKIEKNIPFYPKQYYDKYGCSNCLLPSSRYCMRKKKYIIGDYFGFLNTTAFNAVINNRQNITNKNINNGILVVDEAHLLPNRAKDYLSKTLNFTLIIKKLKKEIKCNYVNRKPNLILPWEATIERLNRIHETIINKNKKEDRFDFESFIKMYDDYDVQYSWEFEDFIVQLKLLIQEGYKINISDYDSKDDPYCKKLLSFIDMWEKRQNDDNYKKRFQYANLNNGTLRFIIDCCDTSNFIQNIFKKWNKVLLNSGTIPDIDFFKSQTGIQNLKTKYENLIESYSIKDNVILYPIGSFKSSLRELEYVKQKDTLNDVVKNLDGRTIIYIQAKYNSRKLISILNTDKMIIDFCSKDNGFEINKQEFEKLTSDFNKSKNSIAIMNINGRVEGFNFESIIDKSSVDNVIVFGYPFARRGMSYDDMLEYYTNIIGSRSIATKWIDYTPILDKIHQAVCRAKRKESDNPVIILWDNQFGDRAFNYMPDDMKGFMTYDNNMLLQKIKEIKNRCNDGIIL